jgi:Ca-activated chloride channel family protein
LCPDQLARRRPSGHKGLSHVMSFGHPTWLWILLVLPALAFFFARAEQRGAERLQQFVAARLLPQLAGTVNRGRRILRFVLLLLVLALVLVSLARPRWGYAFDEVKRKGLDLLFAVDVSRSMLSNDVQPNRLERVKLATQDLLNELQGDRVGLIAFAGRAFLQAPLTIDYDAAVDSINDLDTKTIPEGGTNISDAIALATRTFGKAATGNRALIIFTDGEELSGDAVHAAKAAAETGVRIFAIGVGTPGGSLIPIPGAGGGTAFVKDAKGEVVKSKLDETRLREIAQAADGFYLHLENGPRTMKRLFTEGLGKMQVADINARLSRRPIERYEWPLAAAILFFAIALLINDRKGPRRSVAAKPIATTVAALFLAAAGWARAASPGLELYEQQKFPEAYEHFEKTLQENPGARQSDRIQFDAGAAAYKMQDYNKALQSFSQALLSKNPHLQSEANYNLGNTLYQRGEAEKSDAKKLTNWESALQHYQETLKAEPPNKNAKENYDYVKKKIEDLKKKQEQKPTPTPSPSPSPSPQKDQKKDQKQDDKNQQQKNDQQQKDQQQQSQPQNGEGSGKPENGQPSDQSPTPTPSPTPPPTGPPTPSPAPSASPTPGEDKEQNGGGESPTPTPNPTPSEGEQPGNTPTPDNDATPSPTPGSGEQSGGENDEQPSPTPANTPGKAPTGEVKGAGDEKPKGDEQAAQAEVEPEKEGEMSPKQAQLLLESMKDEEQKVQLDEHKRARPVYNDW